MEIAVGSKPSARPRATVDAHVAEVIAPGVVLLAVAEGFGVIRGVAVPALAVHAIRDALRRRVRADGRDARAALIAAFSLANARVFAHSGSNDDFVASGTSISAALIVGDRAHVAHVGRTRAYLGRDGSLMGLTTDDEIGGDGFLPLRSTVPTDALTGRVLTRTLGTQPTLDATVSNMRLMHGDALVLVSGHFHRSVSEDEIAYALRSGETSEIVTQRLLEIAKVRSGGGGTVIVGRAFTSAVPPADGGRSFTVRTAALALATLVMACIIALAVAQHFLNP